MYNLDWPYANEKPKCTAIFKETPDDFHVDEFFNYPFNGQGEHILVKIQKCGVSTEDVVKSISRLIQKPTKLISYAGLKDRQALATQWISIHAPGEIIPGIESLSGYGWKVIESTRHHKKLKRGYLDGNRFVITLKSLSNPDEFINRIKHIQLNGVPNYFGEQRFGKASANLVNAEQLLIQSRRVSDRFLKGIYLSAARSWIFNLILATRVNDKTWNIPLPGDMMQLRGSNSIFSIDDVGESIIQRVIAHDVSPASPLPGKSKINATREKLQAIEIIYTKWRSWVDGLIHHGLDESWRANILNIDQLTYTLQDQTAVITFSLPPGAYATAVIRELVAY